LLSLSLQFALWTEKWLGKISINLKLEENLLFREWNKGKMPLRKLLVSTMELLILSCYLKVIFFKERWWEWELISCLLLKRDLIVWLDSGVEILSWCLLLSFWRWRWIGIKPAIVLIPKEGGVWKAAKI